MDEVDLIDKDAAQGGLGASMGGGGEHEELDHPNQFSIAFLEPIHGPTQSQVLLRTADFTELFVGDKKGVFLEGVSKRGQGVDRENVGGGPLEVTRNAKKGAGEARRTPGPAMMPRRTTMRAGSESMRSMAIETRVVVAI